MSGFFGSNDSTSRWGGLLKQAISNVETTFDSLLEQPQQNDTKGKTYLMKSKLAMDKLFIILLE